MSVRYTIMVTWNSAEYQLLVCSLELMCVECNIRRNLWRPKKICQFGITVPEKRFSSWRKSQLSQDLKHYSQTISATNSAANTEELERKVWDNEFWKYIDAPTLLPITTPTHYEERGRVAKR